MKFKSLLIVDFLAMYFRFRIQTQNTIIDTSKYVCAESILNSNKSINPTDLKKSKINKENNYFNYILKG